MATLYKCLLATQGATPQYFQAGDAVIYPSYVVMEDTNEEVKVCATSGHPFGVAGCPAYQDMNTAYGIGTRVRVWLLGSGVEIMLLHDGNSGEAVIKGINLIVSTSVAGNVRIQIDYVSKTTTYNLTEHTEGGDTSRFVVGYALETVTITSGTTEFIRAKLAKAGA